MSVPAFPRARTARPAVQSRHGRAGTKLQTLVVDEGFGSQDAEGRDRVVEAIQAISDDFEKILVVTHLDDLRDRFPVRIEVRKTPEGSIISLR